MNYLNYVVFSTTEIAHGAFAAKGGELTLGVLDAHQKKIKSKTIQNNPAVANKQHLFIDLPRLKAARGDYIAKYNGTQESPIINALIGMCYVLETAKKDKVWVLMWADEHAVLELEPALLTGSLSTELGAQ